MDNSLSDTDMVIDRRTHELPLIHLPPIHPFPQQKEFVDREVRQEEWKELKSLKQQREIRN